MFYFVENAKIMYGLDFLFFFNTKRRHGWGFDLLKMLNNNDIYLWNVKYKQRAIEKQKTKNQKKTKTNKNNFYIANKIQP